MEEEFNAVRSAAIYERKRSSTACSVCRARKTKCDGHRPTCGFCRATSGNCRYPEPHASKLDQGSLQVLTRIGQLEESLKTYISEALGNREGNVDVGPSLSHSDYSAADLSGETGELKAPNTTSRLATESKKAKRQKTENVSTFGGVPPSTAVLSHASENSLEAVLRWPIFSELLPYLSTEIHTSTTEILANDGPLATVSEDDIANALRNLTIESVEHLVDNFLSNNNIKNPVLDGATLRYQVHKFNNSGVQWDSTTCLIVRHHQNPV